jgi:hypothetical protein
MDRSDLDVLGDGIPADLGTWTMAQIRARRAEWQRLEDATSYLRRLVQGRLDIVRSASARRRFDRRAFTVADLVAELPETLGDRLVAPVGPRGAQPPHTLIPPDLPDLTAELDAVCDANRLASLAEAPLAELDALEAALEELERAVSNRRRALFERIDVLSGELTRRYRSGEASVDALLG